MEPWYKNEAYSTYLTFAAGILVTTIAYALKNWFEKKKPSIIRVEFKEENSLLHVAPNASRHLQITYLDQPLTKLFQSVFSIQNAGEVPIENIEIKYVIEGLASEEFIEIVTEGLPKDSKLNINREKDGTCKIDLFLPFLNPLKPYKDIAYFDIYSPQPIKVTSASGRGLGWTTSYRDRRQDEESLSDFISKIDYLPLPLALTSQLILALLGEVAGSSITSKTKTITRR